ncbi:MAG: uroporphyrinogen decarboxylase [Oscillospiraceae bacterium]|nr:uroporphyrinogen decarboxylase [Oscillospiraceae bacterium]
MLTIRQNLLETIRGGNPDRFVKQFEAHAGIPGRGPIGRTAERAIPGGPPIVDAWGVTRVWPEGFPGGMPEHQDKSKIVIQDIRHWRDYVKAPETDYPEEDWAEYAEAATKVDRNEYFCTISVAPGLFEQCHHLMSIDVALANMIEEPDHMKDLIKYLRDYELRLAENYTKYSKGDLMFHHDDWGGQNSTFFAPAMFDDFFLEPYKEIYGFYKANGVELIVHHSDSYAATLVPEMIEIGIDVFQGCLTSNNVPDLIAKYGGKISFMGDLNNGVIEVPEWTPELIRAEVERACRTNGKHFFIPCLTAGGAGSTIPGIYDLVNQEIDRMSEIMFA